jgi:hypothetical protein
MHMGGPRVILILWQPCHGKVGWLGRGRLSDISVTCEELGEDVILIHGMNTRKLWHMTPSREKSLNLTLWRATKLLWIDSSSPYRRHGAKNWYKGNTHARVAHRKSRGGYATRNGGSRGHTHATHFVCGYMWVIWRVSTHLNAHCPWRLALLWW